jgi:hypothetical protein
MLCMENGFGSGPVPIGFSFRAIVTLPLKPYPRRCVRTRTQENPEVSMRKLIEMAAIGSAALLAVVAQPALAADVVVETPARGGTVVIENNPASRVVVTEPAPTIRYYRDPGYVALDHVYVEDGCGWLRARALATGSGYWWVRYNDCAD